MENQEDYFAGYKPEELELLELFREYRREHGLNSGFVSLTPEQRKQYESGLTSLVEKGDIKHLKLHRKEVFVTIRGSDTLTKLAQREVAKLREQIRTRHGDGALREIDEKYNLNLTPASSRE